MSKITNTPKRPREFVDLIVVEWDDASYSGTQGDVNRFSPGIRVVSAGIAVQQARKRKSRSYVTFVTDKFPDMGDEVRNFNSVPRGMVLKTKKIRVYL